MKSQILSTSLKVGDTVIKNRIAVPAMADFGMTNPDGLVNERHISRYGAYAKGGAGLIIVEACSVTRFRENRGTIVLDSDACLPGMTKLAKAATAGNAVVLVQIMLTGLSVMPENSIAEINRGKFLEYKADFIAAAIRCQKAGFQGIELHAAHGMYLDEIIETSTRNDGYGGCFENRVRLLDELIQEIKAVCGKGFLVAVRFGNSDYSELLKIATVIKRAGADILDVSTGMRQYQNVPEDFSFDSKVYAASQVKNQTALPVICVGNIVDGQQGEAILEAGYSDIVAIGRGHLCDSEWANKALSGMKPNPCLHCKACMWYVDGRKCSAVRRNGCENEQNVRNSTETKKL